MSTPIELLIEKRDGLLAELIKIQETYGKEISELNQAIKLLGGDKSWAEINSITTYDDETRTYITGTEDGI